MLPYWVPYILGATLWYGVASSNPKRNHRSDHIRGTLLSSCLADVTVVGSSRIQLEILFAQGKLRLEFGAVCLELLTGSL